MRDCPPIGGRRSGGIGRKPIVNSSIIMPTPLSWTQLVDSAVGGGGFLNPPPLRVISNTWIVEYLFIIPIFGYVDTKFEILISNLSDNYDSNHRTIRMILLFSNRFWGKFSLVLRRHPEGCEQKLSNNTKWIEVQFCGLVPMPKSNMSGNQRPRNPNLSSQFGRIMLGSWYVNQKHMPAICIDSWYCTPVRFLGPEGCARRFRLQRVHFLSKFLNLGVVV